MILALSCLIGTILIYWLAKRLYRVVPRVYLTPLLVTPIAVIALIECFHIPYETYNAGSQWLTEMIGPATVALAVPLYKNFAVFKKHAAVILTSVCSGAVVAFVTSVWFAERLHLSTEIMESLAPRSATTPIAMVISDGLGGIPNITAVFVMITGLTGMILGPVVVKMFRIQGDIARGVLFGTSAHAAGTAKAFEFGAVAGTISSIAMMVTAFVTLGFAPWLIKIFS
ncbi:LrgB family protein [Paenibacillus xerothermodurans]|uniref:LrgB family protein n=1 Tax=Paenibacillus xerothermodurans TaxID=1977292 RepID=A0A2W1NP93_PAEXE|nr:LrgB family protein [Paenibacillus xerothermodurans]PZE20733.1 LrgB family protein [Paenibacillus xerothermodurans]